MEALWCSKECYLEGTVETVKSAIGGHCSPVEYYLGGRLWSSKWGLCRTIL